MKIDKILNSEDDFATSTFVSGLFAGLLAGLAVGILLAPESGKKTRKGVKRMLAKQKKEFQYKLDEAKKQAKGTFETIKGALE